MQQKQPKDFILFTKVRLLLQKEKKKSFWKFDGENRFTELIVCTSFGKVYSLAFHLSQKTDQSSAEFHWQWPVMDEQSGNDGVKQAILEQQTRMTNDMQGD